MAAASAPSRHDFIIGGSGMLAGLCLQLASEGRVVSVLGRNRDRLRSLAARDASIDTYAADYRDGSQLQAALDAACQRHGPIERLTAWMDDDDAPKGILAAAAACQAFCHILGSAAGDPGRPDVVADWQDAFRARLPQIEYRIAVLGFVVTGNGTARWLSHAEICAGVRRALDGPAAVTIVGTVEPWSARP